MNTVAIPVPSKVLFIGMRRDIVRELNSGVEFCEPEGGVSETWMINLPCMDENLEKLKMCGDDGFYLMFFRRLHERVKELSETLSNPRAVPFKLLEVGMVPKCEGMVLYRVANDMCGDIIIPKYCLERFMGKGIACIYRRSGLPEKKIA